MHRLIPVLIMAAASFVGSKPDDAQPKDIPPAAAKADPIVSPPRIDGPKEITDYDTFRIVNLPPEAGVDWTWPEGIKAVDVECECQLDDKGKAIPQPYEAKVRVSGPPGAYTVKAKLLRYNASTKRAYTTNLDPVTFTIKGNGPLPPPPVPPVPPGPNPPVPPGPGPTPEPGPVGKIAGFAVVEDSKQAGQWRGDLLGSPNLVAYYKGHNLKHRLIDINASDNDGALDPVAAAYVKAVKGKESELPYLFTWDEKGKVTAVGKIRTDSADAFIAQLGGEADHARAMGNIPPPDNKRKYQWKQFGASPNVPSIPRDQWRNVNLEAFLPPVHDQDGIGACNAFASITATEAGRKQAGLPYVPLSPAFLYGAINGGRDQGSMLEDGLAWMTEKGTVKVDTVGYLAWQTGRRNMSNPTFLAEAKGYRVIEAYECPTFAHVASALQQGFFIVEGLLWYNNFTPDREGWLPSRGTGRPGGHALCGYGLVQRNGVWGIRTRNSWGASWGIGGNCVIPEPLFGQDIGGFWAVRAVVQTNENVLPIPGALGRHREYDYALAP